MTLIIMFAGLGMTIESGGWTCGDLYGLVRVRFAQRLTHFGSVGTFFRLCSLAFGLADVGTPVLAVSPAQQLLLIQNLGSELMGAACARWHGECHGEPGGGLPIEYG